tara:strand:+ start:352 stop:468 length:117 start_codon:yes stop_codon:yes gene_type:complete
LVDKVKIGIIKEAIIDPRDEYLKIKYIDSQTIINDKPK